MPRGTTLQDSAKIEGRLWSPRVTNPIIWVNAADYSSFAFSSLTNVQTWQDRGSSNSSFTNSVSANQPYVTASMLNGLPGLVFSGNQWLQGNSTSWSSEPSTTFIVAKINGNGYQGIIETAINTGMGFGWSAGGAYSLFRSNVQDLSFSLGRTSGVDITTWNSTGVDVALSSATVSLRRNGTPAASSQSGQPFATTNLTTIGAYLNGTNDKAIMSLYEIIVTKRLDSIGIHKVEGYLGWKWGLVSNLSTDHPYRYKVPLIDAG